MIQITVLGRAQPAGSKRAFAIRRKSGKLGVSVVDDAERSRPWKDSVTAAAHEVLNGAEPLDGPLELHVDFYVARPAGHYGTGKNRSLVKASAPRFPATRPDASKLCRCIEDALTDAGVWRDDAQVVKQVVSKRYGHPERAEIRILRVEEQP
jgi:crossover junction endodeoxyribonuclease RusA